MKYGTQLIHFIFLLFIIMQNGNFYIVTTSIAQFLIMIDFTTLRQKDNDIKKKIKILHKHTLHFCVTSDQEACAFSKCSIQQMSTFIRHDILFIKIKFAKIFIVT